MIKAQIPKISSNVSQSDKVIKQSCLGVEFVMMAALYMSSLGELTVNGGGPTFQIS